MNPFLALPDDVRRQQLDAYVQFLRERDGAMDLKARTLSRRVEYFQRLEREQVRWQGPLERDAFHRNLDRRPEKGLPLQVTWLLAAAKSNRGERYGVELALAKGQGGQGTPDEVRRYIELEELVHTRILADACRLFGLEFTPRPPPPMQRALIQTMVRLPDAASLPLVLCGEVVGVVGFRLLRERVHLFDAEPAVRDRLVELVEQILLDEVGHVLFNRAVIGAPALKAAQAALPVVARAMVHDTPEFATLAGSTQAFLERVRTFELGEAALPPALRFAA